MNCRLPSLNDVKISGNLTDDPRKGLTQGGKVYISFSVAHNKNFKSGGEWKSYTTYVNVTLWGDPAEYVFEKLHKGSPVVVEGELYQSRWEGNDGQKRERVEITARRVQAVEKQDSGYHQDNGSEGPAPAGDEPDYSDDIPF